MPALRTISYTNAGRIAFILGSSEDEIVNLLMTPATLIYNPHAGGTAVMSAPEIIEHLGSVGFEVKHIETLCEEDLDKVIKKVDGIVFVAGGDGTIRAVATRAIGKPGISIAPIPLGTANNVGNTLGIVGDTKAVIMSYANAIQATYDVGRIKAPWGEEYFIEASGGGLYADTLAAYDPEHPKSLLRSLQAMTKTLPRYEGYELDIEVDNKSISGTFLMFEVLNTHSAGPRLKFSSAANPTDGLFNLILVREDNRHNFLTYTQKMFRGELAVMDNVEDIPCKKVVISWDGYPVHVDGLVRTDVVKLENHGETIVDNASRSARTRPTITLEIIPQALGVLLPNTANHA